MTRKRELRAKGSEGRAGPGPSAEGSEEREGTLSLLRLSGNGRVWVLSGLLAVLAALLFWAGVVWLRPADAPVAIPWWGLALLFALAEIFVVHVEFRRDAYSFSVSEVVLVLGLLFAEPSELVGAYLLGGGLALVLHRRQSPLKVAFNLSHWALEACLAALIFHGVFGVSDPFGPMAWAATFLAVFVANTVADMSIGLAISLSEGAIQKDVLLQGLPFGMIATITNTSLSLVSAIVVWVSPAAAWLLLVPAATLFVAYRAYTAERQKHESLELLYQTMHRIQRSVVLDSALRDLLEATRRMFRADIAEITFLPDEAHQETEAHHMSIGPGEGFSDPAPADLDPTKGVWARAVSEDQAILVPRPIANPRLAAHYGSLGMRDLMVAPLHGQGGVVGILRVANRLGDVSTFDQEDLKLFESLAIHAGVALENARLVERLRESLDRLTESNRVKDDFVATVSHELRTPLTVMRGFIKTLMREDVSFDRDQQRGFLEAADRGGGRLHELIEQLLTVSRIEANREAVAMAPVALAPVIEQVVRDLESRRNGHVVDLEGTRSLPTIETDGAKVQQIMSNLLENAFKYSPAGTTVTVWGEVTPSQVVLLVRDRGEGIAPEHQERVFDRFFQIDSSATRDVGGTGLGLYICRRLAEEIGADLRIDRSGPDGSVFSLAIPRRGTSGERPDLQIVSSA